MPAEGTMQRNRIETYLDFVRPLYAGRDPGHDFDHIVRITQRLDFLTRGFAPRPIRRRLYFLAAFHGLHRDLTGDDELRNQVRRFLLELGWNDDEIGASLASLRTHLTAPQTPEEAIVHDANYFEVTGAFGIAKAFTVGGARGQSYEESLARFEANLDKLRFRTPVGIEVWEGRKSYARAFVQELRRDLARLA